MKIPIRKTNRKVPVSRWQLEYMLFENNPVLISNTLKMSVPPIKVKDISKGLEDPLTTDRLQRDINAFRKKFPPIWPERKPSLLTRVKERFKR